MARPLRIEYEGALYHVTSRGNAGARIFFDDRDRARFLAVLEQAVERSGWVCHAYCLMPNHYHLLIETPRANLSWGMRHLNGVYTQATNRRHKRSGHLFQGRFKAILVERERYLLQVARYIALNPVRAKMVKAPGDWPWSSYRATIGEAATPGFLTTRWLLEGFHTELARARKAYRDFVDGGIGIPLWDNVRSGVVLGGDAFVEQVKPILRGTIQSREIPRRERSLAHPSLSKLLAGTEGDRTLRNQRIYEAVRVYGYRLSEVQAVSGLHYSTISRIVKREEASRRSKGKT